jgi:DNA-binding NtrC family response regulator
MAWTDTAEVLLIDGDPARVSAQLRRACPAPRCSVAVDGASGIEHVRTHRPDVILLDLELPDGPGLDAYQAIRAIDAHVPIIFVATTTNAGTAIEAMKRGAFNYLLRPIDRETLQSAIGEALDVARRMRAEVGQSAVPKLGCDGEMIGTCRAMLEVYKAIGRVANPDVTVLITGESGTGKELVARAIHEHSARADAPFLALNCAAIPEQLLESELFGHEKGAFTGADRRRIGKFEQCRGGTLLLDEIGDMPLALQTKVLRLLQEQTFERVGGNETVRCDVRLIAATHQDLKPCAAGDRFRGDLYYRLGVFTIHLPPLRERGDDLELLVRHYVRIFAASLGRDVSDISPDAMQRLREYSWPGNVRELQSVLKQALLRAHGRELLPGFLPSLTDEARQPSGPADELDVDKLIGSQLCPGADDVYAVVHRAVDRVLLSRALEYTNGNHRDASRLLGISRQTMRVKLRALGLHLTHIVESDDHFAS